MSAPQPTAADEEDDSAEEPPDAFDDAETAEEPPQEEVEVDLADTNIGKEVDEAFDAIEDADRPNAPDEPRDDFDPFDGSSSDEGGDDDDLSGEDLSDAIIEGTSRLAVMGLDEEFEVNGSTKTKDDLRQEFAEVFTAFRLGEFGSEVAEEYLFVDEDIDPVMGFLAASLCCTAMVLWMRPDGEELARGAYDRVATVGTGGIL